MADVVHLNTVGLAVHSFPIMAYLLQRNRALEHTLQDVIRRLLDFVLGKREDE